MTLFYKFAAAIGLGAAAVAHVSAAPFHEPYADRGVNAIYNLLFCDDAKAYSSNAGQAPARWQALLFAEPADAAALEQLAADPAAEGRVRYLAFARLRAIGRTVPPKVVLAVIVEVPLANGLDTLAAFSEGGVRYINQSGKLAVMEDVPTLRPTVQRLFEHAAVVVGRIGAWDKPRLAPPAKGNIRLTFLVSDGLYFGEGPMAVMQKEPMAAPVIDQAVTLLQQVVALGSR